LGLAPDGYNDTTGCTFNALLTSLVSSNYQWNNMTFFYLPTPLLQKKIIIGAPEPPAGGDSAGGVTYDASGHLYVGDGDNNKLYKFDGSGVLDQVFTPDFDPWGRGITYIDLASDQCTVFYTGQGIAIKRFDVCHNQQLPDLLGGLDPYTYGAMDFRILPDQSVLLTTLVDIRHYSKTGTLLKTYNAPGETDPYLGWAVLALGPDDQSFWAGSIFPGNLYRFNISTGQKLLGPIASGAGPEPFPPNDNDADDINPGALGGICVDGEYHAAVGTLGNLLGGIAGGLVGTGLL
jgi:hypothetical protein